MYQALFYKEWCKTKRIVMLALVIFSCVVVYTFINTGQMFRVSGATAIWSNVIQKSMSILPPVIEWMPLIVSLLLAFSQFAPEMTDKRLKLTLHLPMPENRIITTMLLYGTCVLGIFYILTYAGLLLGLSFYYPSEIIYSMVWQSVPWFLVGILAYFLVAWICIEPAWIQRILNALIALCIFSFFFISAKPGAYICFLPYLLVVAIACFSFPFYSTARFKDGAQ